MEPSKILVIKLRSLGDTVLMTAPLAALRRAYPSAEIHAVVPEKWASVLDGSTAVNHVWRYDEPSRSMERIRALGRLAMLLRRERYDTAIALHARSSSAWLARATGAPVRSVHFHGAKHRNSFSTVKIAGKGVVKPAIERDMDALRAIGVPAPPGEMPRVEVSDAETRRAHDLIEGLGLRRPILGLGLGASRATKIWPIERFAGLALEWCRDTQGTVLALTGPLDRALSYTFYRGLDERLREHKSRDSFGANALKARVAHLSNLPLRDLAAVLKLCSVYAGNDSGPKHLAVAVGTPTVTLFGPEHPLEWHPYPLDLHPYLFVEDLPCRKDAPPGAPPWCALAECVVEGHKCMRQIPVERAYEEIRRFLPQ